MKHNSVKKNMVGKFTKNADLVPVKRMKLDSDIDHNHLLDSINILIHCHKLTNFVHVFINGNEF